MNAKVYIYLVNMPVPFYTQSASQHVPHSLPKTALQASAPLVCQQDSTDCNSQFGPNVEILEADIHLPSKRLRDQNRVVDCCLALSPLEQQQKAALQAFNQFVKSAGAKKDDVLIGLVRSLRTYAKFCKDCDERGFEAAFALQVSRHRYIDSPCYLKVKATADSERRFRGLWERACSLATCSTDRALVYDTLIAKVTGLNRQFSLPTQAALFRSKEARQLYFHILEFLDDFTGTGQALMAALKLQGEAAELRQKIYFEYMYSLGLAPFDGLGFHTVFHLQYVQFEAV